MLPALMLIKKILFSPIWLLWQLYLGLWWAFTDAPAQQCEPGLRIDQPEPDLRTETPQCAAFEIIDSRQPSAPTPRPEAALRAGFASTLIGSALLAWAEDVAFHRQLIRHAMMLPVWVWATCILMLLTLWMVRHIARRHAAESPTTWTGHARCIAGGVKDMGCTIGAATVQVKNTTVTGATRVQSAARWAANTPPVRMVRRATRPTSV